MTSTARTLLIAPLLAVAGCGGSDRRPAPAPAHADVPIANFKFAPRTLTVARGATVTWTNRDKAPDTATAQDGSFDTDTLRGGRSKTLTLDKPGTYSYYCVYHRFMTATITVE
jgi:plastocyanin